VPLPPGFLFGEVSSGAGSGYGKQPGCWSDHWQPISPWPTSDLNYIGENPDVVQTNIALILIVFFSIVLRNSWNLLVELPNEKHKKL
jgi:hypothetical protein